jgi:hypothetical protein
MLELIPNQIKLIVEEKKVFFNLFLVVYIEKFGLFKLILTKDFGDMKAIESIV